MRPPMLFATEPTGFTFSLRIINFAFVGADLNSARRDCNIVRGHGSDNPAEFDDRKWLAGFWTEDSQSIFALVHNELPENLRPSLCPSRIYFQCWYNSIVAAQSKDGGFHFYRPQDAVVAAPDAPYSVTPGRPVGYFAPSNIIKRNDYHYAMIWAEKLGSQKRGQCLFRTSNLALGSSWSARDGRSFTSLMKSPYLKAAGEESSNVCEPLHQLDHVRGIVQHWRTGLYLAFMMKVRPRLGLYVSSSPDLLHWSTARLALDLETVVGPNCEKAPRLGYPSLIDPSTDRNFTTVGDTGFCIYQR
jgi:hypothetical protein